MVGYRFIHDEKFWYEIVPSIAVSAGNYNSISPGILAAGGVGRVAFIGDLEYSFSVDADDVNFFYTRLEFLADIANGFYGGINFQRTQIFETENFLDAGVQAGVYFGAFDLCNPVPAQELSLFIMDVEFVLF